MSARVSIFKAPVRVVHWYDVPVFYVPGSACEAIVMSILDRALNLHRPIRVNAWRLS